MIMLDTNVISEATRPGMDANAKHWLVSQPIDSLFTTSISLAEIVFGIERLPDGLRKHSVRTVTNAIFDLYLVGRTLPFDEAAAQAYGRRVASAQAKGRSILFADGQIAAIARVHGFAVATRDVTPFEAAGVDVIDPWAL